MTNDEKREERIRNNIKNVSLIEFKFLVKKYGQWIEGGSHPKAIINGHTFPFKRVSPVNYHYVQRILEIIDEMKEEE
jgi:hypothetical protein